MTPEIEKLNKAVIQSDRTSPEAKRDAIESMWDGKIKGMLFDKTAMYIETEFTEKEKLELKADKCDLYFRGITSSSFGFKGHPSAECTQFHESNYETSDYELNQEF